MRKIDEDELAIIAEIARMYYIEGMSQLEISNLLFLSKPKVSRALKIARKQKIVEFTINYPLKQSVKLEAELKRIFSLENALVVTDLRDNLVAEVSIKRIGEMTASYLDSILKDGDTLGLSWGKTICQVVQHLKPTSPRNIHVFQLVGSPIDDYINGNQIPKLVQEMATAFQGIYSLLYAPMYIENDIVRRELMKEPIISMMLQKIRSVHYVLTGIATVQTENGNNTWAGYLTDRKRNELIKKGAVGYICGYFIDQDGHKVNDKINNKIIGIQFEELKKIPHVIAVAGGLDKTQAIYAALKGNLIDCLITDSRIAEKLIMMSKKGD